MSDLAIITDIYGAGEDPIKGINGPGFYRRLNKNNTMYLKKEQLMHLLPKMLLDGDIFVTIGAGDIGEIGAQIFREL